MDRRLSTSRISSLARRIPSVANTSSRLRLEAETLLGDAAFVLRMTQKIRQELTGVSRNPSGLER